MSARPMSPGLKLAGRYRLEDLLSEHSGAMFWRATDLVLERNVAVHAVSSDDPRSEPVLDAARRSAGLGDPRFLSVLDCDDEDGLTWVVNEWGEGISLDVLLGQGPLAPARAAWIAREVAEAIASAHEHGLEHGRLNPESVLITSAGTVRVIGFVVNAALAGDSGAEGTTPTVSPREADVINLAGVLYAALTGRWPSSAAPSVLPAAPREGHRTLRPRQVRAGVPRVLDTLCDRVLHREAAQHALPIESAHEVAAALTDYLGDHGVAVRVPAGSEPAPADPEDGPPGAGAPLEPPTAVAEGGSAGAADADVPAPEAAAPPPPAPEPPAPEPPDPEPPRASDPSLDTAAEQYFEPEAWDPEPEAPGTDPGTDPGPTADPGVPADPAVLADLDDLDDAAPAARAATPAAEPKPLFADHERRVPDHAPPPAPPTIPQPEWLFDPDPGSVPARVGRRHVLLVLVLILVLGGAAVAGIQLWRAESGSPGPAGPTETASPSPTSLAGQPIKVVSVRDFDPEGNPPRENPETVGNVIDGDPSTSWTTSTYRGNPRLGGLKSGVGVLLDLGATRSVGSVQLSLVGAPTSVELYGTDPGVSTPPAELADTSRLGAVTSTGNSAVFRLDPAARTRYLVVWLTSLPPVTGGYRGEISEIVVRP